MNRHGADSAGKILFGLNRTEDERSLALFLQLFSREEFAGLLIPRLSDGEIDQVVTLLTSIMRRHLTESEYHSIFLAESGHHS